MAVVCMTTAISACTGKTGKTGGQAGAELKPADSSDAAGQKSEVIAGHYDCSVYYLQDGKIRFRDFETHESGILNLGKKTINDFWFSPTNDYIVFICKKYSDDYSFEALYIYDRKNQKETEIATSEYSRIFVSEWKSDNTFSYVEIAVPSINGFPESERGEKEDESTYYDCKYTIGGKAVKKKDDTLAQNQYSRRQYFQQYEHSRYEISDESENIEISIENEDVAVTNKQTNAKQIISVADGENFFCEGWLTSEAFLFSNRMEQGDGFNFDLYLYETKTNTTLLIQKGFDGFISLVKK